MKLTVEQRLDITGRMPIDGSHHNVAWVFAPAKPTATVPLLSCLPGGSYTKAILASRAYSAKRRHAILAAEIQPASIEIKQPMAKIN